MACHVPVSTQCAAAGAELNKSHTHRKSGRRLDGINRDPSKLQIFALGTTPLLSSRAVSQPTGELLIGPLAGGEKKHFGDRVGAKPNPPTWRAHARYRGPCASCRARPSFAFRIRGRTGSPRAPASDTTGRRPRRSTGRTWCRVLAQFWWLKAIRASTPRAASVINPPASVDQGKKANVTRWSPAGTATPRNA